MRKSRICSLALASALVVVLNMGKYAEAATVVTLPDPNLYAVKIDDFYSYSTAILIALGNLGIGGINPADYDFKAGSGNINLGIFTGNNAISNNNTSQGFPIPVASPNGNQSSTLNDTWGIQHGSDVNVPILVDTVLSYLHNNFGKNINIPVFIFDYNQNQNSASLTADGQVLIKDGNGNEVKQWSFDAIDDSLFEPGSPVTVPATVQYPPNSPTPIVGPIAANRGSGKADFINFAPDMDLSLYAGKGYTIQFSFNLANLNGGFEELFLNGQFAAPSEVPEPATMLLLGLGVLGAAVSRKWMGKAA